MSDSDTSGLRYFFYAISGVFLTICLVYIAGAIWLERITIGIILCTVPVYVLIFSLRDMAETKLDRYLEKGTKYYVQRLVLGGCLLLIGCAKQHKGTLTPEFVFMLIPAAYSLCAFLDVIRAWIKIQHKNF